MRVRAPDGATLSHFDICVGAFWLNTNRQSGYDVNSWRSSNHEIAAWAGK